MPKECFGFLKPLPTTDSGGKFILLVNVPLARMRKNPVGNSLNRQPDECAGSRAGNYRPKKII
jgi:hypothetical protein